MADEGYRIIDSEAISKDLKYEPPLIIAFGADEKTAGSKTITMGRTIIPPKGRNQRQQKPIGLGPGKVADIPPGRLHSS